MNIVYQSDPMGRKVGGIDTFIKGMIKFAPEHFDVDYLGVTFDQQKRPAKKWIDGRFGKKDYVFYPLLAEKLQNKKKVIPLSLRFAAAALLDSLRCDNRLLFFHKLDPAIAFLKYRSPKVLMIHNDIEKQINQRESEVVWNKFPFIYHRYEKYMFKKFEHIYCVNSKTCAYYKNKYQHSSDKFSFLATWVDTETFRLIDQPKKSLKQRLSKKWNIPIRKDWVIFVGRLQEQKSPLRLLETFAEVMLSNNDAQLIIVGEGNLKNKCVNFVNANGLSANVTFLDPIQQENIAELLQSMDAFLLTSNYEGMPMSVLESLGCGVPVVSTNVGEVSRVLKNGFNGEVNDGFEPKEIAEKLVNVLNNPDRYSKENCLHSISDYIPKKILEPVYKQLENIYKSEIKNEKPASIH